jgi:hypothetical protein
LASAPKKWVSTTYALGHSFDDGIWVASQGCWRGLRHSFMRDNKRRVAVVFMVIAVAEKYGVSGSLRVNFV